MKKSYLRLVRRTFRALRHRRLRDRPWWRALTKPLFERSLWMPCRDTVANGLAIGLFFAVIPMIPQSIFAAVVAMRFKANVPVATGITFLSNPLTNGPIWISQAFLGRWCCDTFAIPMPHFMKQTVNIPYVGALGLGSGMVGIMVSAVLLGLLAYPLTHLFSAVLPQHLPKRKARTQRVKMTSEFAEPD